MRPVSFGKWALAKRVLCDECTPNPVGMKISIALLVFLAVGPGLIAFFFLLRWHR
jgi:hypothetical protein